MKTVKFARFRFLIYTPLTHPEFPNLTSILVLCYTLLGLTQSALM